MIGKRYIVRVNTGLNPKREVGQFETYRAALEVAWYWQRKMPTVVFDNRDGVEVYDSKNRYR